MEESIRKPTCGYMYLVANGTETSYFKTEEEAKEFASVLISECMRDDELWDKEVEHIAIAKVTHVAQAPEKEYRPDDLDEDNCSADGSHWPDEVEWRGNYVMAEMEPDKAQQLLEAANAVIKRWDSPLWKHQEHTGKFIDELRKAVARFDVENYKHPDWPNRPTYQSKEEMNNFLNGEFKCDPNYKQQANNENPELRLCTICGSHVFSCDHSAQEELP